MAVAQAEEVKSGLKKLHLDFQFEIKKIKTSADTQKDVAYKLIGPQGIFTKQIDEALLKGEINLAVHSMKDVPTDLPAGITIIAITKRKNPSDVLVARGGLKLTQLPDGARVGTGSIRRRAQLLRVRKDLEIVPIRGNLDTRLKKLRDSQLNAIVVAQAGVERLNYKNLEFEPLSWEIMLPAAGQGSLAIEVRADDQRMIEVVSRLNHEESSWAVEAERAFLKTLGGGCRVPIAALGRVRDGRLQLEGIVLSSDGNQAVRWQICGEARRARELGNELAESLLLKGAREILK